MPTLTVSFRVLKGLATLAEARGLSSRYELEDVLAQLLEAHLPSSEGSWSHSGVVIPEDTALRFTYLDQRFEGRVRDGLLEFGDVREESPSKAAALAIQARTGKVLSLNGWTTIQADCASGTTRGWRKLSDLRLEAQEVAR